MAKLWSCMICYCVVWLGGTIVPCEHSFSTFRVQGWAVIGIEVGTEFLQPRLQANCFTHSHSSISPFLIFITISSYIACSFSLKMETADSSKHLYPSTKLLGVTTHRTTLWILTTVRTWTSQSQWQIRKARVQNDKLKYIWLFIQIILMIFIITFTPWLYILWLIRLQHYLIKFQCCLQFVHRSPSVPKLTSYWRLWIHKHYNHNVKLQI